MDHTDGISSAKLETGGIITPTAPSVASYSFVPPIHFTETNKELRSPVITRSLDVSVSPTKSPKPLPTDSFYSRIGRFPFQIKQMTYSSDDITSSRKLRNDDAKQAILNTARSEPYDPLNKDIVQQVNHWMRNKPLSDSFMCSITPRSSFSPSSGRPLPRERERRRRYKRHKVSDADDRHPIESSMTSQDSDMSISLDPLRDTLRRRRHHQEFDSKYNRLTGNSRTFSDQKQGSRDKDKRSIFGSVHNEIEFQKRYRRMFDLNKHLQFVNSTNGLKGQKIASKKMHHLPPMNQKQYETLERSEMFAINTVTKTNDPEDKEVTPRTIWKNMAAGSTSTISTNADSAIDKSLSSFSKVSSSHTKSDMGKFDRLPEISTNSDKIAASNPDENDIYKETVETRDGDSETDGDVLHVTSRCSTKATTEVTKSRASRASPESKMKCFADDELSECSSEEGLVEIHEMKVTINIRYKPEVEKSTRKSKKSKSQQKTSKKGYDGYNYHNVPNYQNVPYNSPAITNNYGKLKTEKEDGYLVNSYDKVKDSLSRASINYDDEFTLDPCLLAE